MKTEAFFLCVILLGFPSHFYADEHKVFLQDNGDKVDINVGVIIDVGSWVGKVVRSSIAMAVSDFYNQNGGYRTRIALHVRDSRGDSLHCIAAGERLRSNVSKFVMVVWLFIVLILTSSYTAKLSSLLTIEQIKLTRSDYVGYHSHNSVILEMGVSNLDLKDNGPKPFRSPVDYDKALRQGRKKGGFDAILDELPYLKIFVAKYPHDYAIIESSIRTSGFGFAFPKGSPLVHDISRAIAELREEGTLLQLESKWFSSQLSPSSQDTKQPNDPNPLTRDNFFGLFLLSGISKSIAVLVVLIFLLREKLSINYYISAVLARGKLMLILRYLYPRMVNIDGEEMV